MVSAQALVASFASTVVRVFAYIFLRWIPGHPFPGIIFSSAAVYAVSFLYCACNDTSYEIVAEEVDVEIKHVNGDALKYRTGSVIVDSSDDEVEVDVTQVLEEKDHRPFRTMLTGLPNPSSKLWSAATSAVNAILVILVAQFTFQTTWVYPASDLSFARVGYVSHHDARILVREPYNEYWPLNIHYRLADRVAEESSYKLTDRAWVSAGGISELTEATDYTTTFTISGLKPSTRYQYHLTNNRSGHIITAPRPASPLYGPEITSGGSFTFVHSSCLIPNFPFNPFAHPLNVAGFRYLASWLSKIRPAFMLFLGDFIYVDVPRRHGSSVEDYRREYRQVYASPDWPSVSHVDESSAGPSYDLPWLHVYDDHEIANDWSGNTSGVFPAAFDPYLHYHLSPGPPLVDSSSILPSAANPQLTPEALAHSSTPTWSTFNHGPASFFLVDTRRYRTPANASNPWSRKPTLIGTDQLSALIQWLKTPAAPGVSWKVLVSSVPFTANWRVNALDTWSGYRYERREILEVMWRVQAYEGTGIVILSGDRHEFAATAFPPPKNFAGMERIDVGKATVHEFSNSPLSMFYLPFRTYQEDTEISRKRSWTRHLSWFPSLLPTSQTIPRDSSTRAFMGIPDRDWLEHDVSLAYIPEGNSKFGIVDIEEPTGSGQSVLKYRAVIDGEEVWSHVLLSGPKTGRSVLEKSIWG